MKKNIKKKLLYLSQCFPYPPDGGGTIKSFNTLITLAKEYDVVAIFISERSGSKESKKFFKKLGIKIKVFKTYTMMESIKNNYFRLFWNYLQLRPHFVYQYRYIPGIKYIRGVIKNWKPDIIHVDHINSSQFLPSKLWLKINLPTFPYLVLENHNLNHLIFKTRFYETTKLIRKLYLFLEGSLNYLYGLVNYGRYDHIFSISESETQYLKKYYKSVSTQPLVYPFPMPSKSAKKSGKYDILFVGNLNWPPNELAIMWFLDEIFPLIKKKIPSVNFHIVGKYNKKFKPYKGSEGVLFYGYQNNLNKFLSEAKVFILPFKTGGGVRIKSLTALQYGIPIVSTSLGVEGLNLEDNKDFLLANSYTSFADCIIKLFKNTKLQNRISSNETKYFINNHGMDKNKIFLNKYIELTNHAVVTA